MWKILGLVILQQSKVNFELIFLPIFVFPFQLDRKILVEITFQLFRIFAAMYLQKSETLLSGSKKRRILIQGNRKLNRMSKKRSFQWLCVETVWGEEKSQRRRVKRLNLRGNRVFIFVPRTDRIGDGYKIILFFFFAPLAISHRCHWSKKTLCKAGLLAKKKAESAPSSRELGEKSTENRLRVQALAFEELYIFFGSLFLPKKIEGLW